MTVGLKINWGITKWNYWIMGKTLKKTCLFLSSTRCMLMIYHHLHIEAKIKWPPFSTRLIQMHFLNENVWIMINISLMFVPKDPINNIPALFQVMAWCRSGDKPLSEPLMVSLLTHICITWPQWVKCLGICRHNDDQIWDLRFEG